MTEKYRGFRERVEALRKEVFELDALSMRLERLNIQAEGRGPSVMKCFTAAAPKEFAKEPSSLRANARALGRMLNSIQVAGGPLFRLHTLVKNRSGLGGAVEDEFTQTDNGPLKGGFVARES